MEKREGGGEKRGPAKPPPPPPLPFSPPRATNLFQNSASGFSRKKVRILFRRHSYLSLRLRDNKFYDTRNIF